MAQYNAIKARHPDALLLFRVGDFYETFGADAIQASKVLGIVLTKRSNGGAADVELAGFPHHSLDSYLPRLVQAGLRVAICDQLEDPKKTKKLVKRGVTELVTPGLATGDKILEQGRDHYLAALCPLGKSGSETAHGLALLDLSTGRFLVGAGSPERIDRLLEAYQPAEILLPRNTLRAFRERPGQRWYTYPLEDWIFAPDFGADQLEAHFSAQAGTSTKGILKGFGLDLQRGAGQEGSGQDDAAMAAAAGAVLHYLGQTEHKRLGHIQGLERLVPEAHVWLDRFSARNLELLAPLHPDGHALIDILNRASSPMGARMMRRWLAMPLLDVQRIEARLDAVQALVSEAALREALETRLSDFGDVERLLAKVALGKAGPRDLAGIRGVLRQLPELAEDLSDSGRKALLPSAEGLEPCSELLDILEAGLAEEPPAQLGKGPAIRKGRSAELDELRTLRQDGRQYLDDLRQREAERTGIASLKVGFNNVFGYYLEATKKYSDQVPEDWVRKQTLVGSERYITEELKGYEEKILSAEERIEALEQALFAELCAAVLQHIDALQENAAVLARLDVLACFARNAIDFGYRRPELHNGLTLSYTEGRHPVIERLLPPGEAYVPNDLVLDPDDQQLLILTGPNMSGKSALLRQTALIALMAQAGSFVPAQKASIGIVDKVFTRVGASDNLSGGHSTFMVEMHETASIVNNLTPRSLVVLDEIGRGTSTYDGISIAWALAEFLHGPTEASHRDAAPRPRTLFATHYHELSALAARFPRIRNGHIATRELDGRIVFLRKLQPGGSQHSFGIHVARMAGMHPTVVERASQLLAELERRDAEQAGLESPDETSAGYAHAKAPDESSQELRPEDGAANGESTSAGDLPANMGSRRRRQQGLEAAASPEALRLQLSIFDVSDPALGEVRKALEDLDVDRLTPVDALLKLKQLQHLLQKD
jgi:DNA mismatch repair protein MutS